MSEDYLIDPQDYINLLDSIDNLDNFKSICSKYIIYNNDSKLSTNLYQLLIKDKWTKELFYLSKNVADFNYVLKSMPGFTTESLTSLIELIGKSTSNDSKFPLKLFDVKYHMFMKAPDGAFITLGDHKDLSLLTVNQINGYKAFKIGICQNCKTPYIMGITENNMLCIDDEIDIDESYASKAKRLEYYVIADCLTKDEIDDIEVNPDFEKYYVCSKCGFIKKAKSAVSGNDCEHFLDNKTVLYKFIGKDDQELDDDDIVTNNLHRCPVCEYKANNGGVVMGFHVGKDRATALISQILYESMEYPKIEVKNQGLSLLKKEKKFVNGKKQFLAFSDSRQQASFFSKFLNSNNKRFMKKIMIWDILKENNHQEISYGSLIDKLTQAFKTKFHYDDEKAEKEAICAVLWELLLVDGRNSGEGIGLFAFKPVLPKSDDPDLGDSVINEALITNGFNNITPDDFRNLINIVVASFRKMPAIDYILKNVDYEERKEMLGYRQKTYNVIRQGIKKGKDDPDEIKTTKSFLPVMDDETKKSSVNNIVKYTIKAFSLSSNDAKRLLELVFGTIILDEMNLSVCMNDEVTDENLKEYRIKASSFNVHSYKNLKFYRCKKCNKVTLYNINSKCTEADCTGELEEISPDEEPLLANNYYRNEYLSRPAEDLVCREHTAQINAKEAQEIQDSFKNQKINFISCSTTFEMGIDLGGLNTIFMRNVPPTSANYAQRAGRAGRRAETSAFVLTFCGPSSHDYTFFNDPPMMIKGMVEPPYFVIDNEKILLRHISATALSLYFREPEFTQDFDTVSHFLENDVTDKFINYIKSKPQKLGDVIDEYLLTDKALKEKFGNFKWIDYLSESESALKNMKEGLESLIQLYKDAQQQAYVDKDFSAYNSYKDALERMNTKNSLITGFTSYNVIPGYGFPIDNVELYIYDFDKQEMSDEYNLSRNLSVAISEYAPGSEIIVNEKKYTSRYIRLPYKNYHLPETFYCECPKCHTVNTSEDNKHFVDGVTCEYCGEKLDVSGTNVKRFFTPIYGFIADRKNKDTGRVKPFKTYASEVYYIGSKLSQETEFNDVIEISEHENEKLLVLNESRFYFCPSCGYTDLDRRNQNSTKTIEHHEYNGRKCECGKKLELTHLGYSYMTDIIQINFKGIKQMEDEETALSVLFAILEGISITYSIERDDINGMIYSVNIAKPYSLILFDTVPGGAGHVKRLKDSKSLLSVINNALTKVSQNCCGGEDGDTSCYNCLRTYNNQRFHKHLKRGLAKNALEEIKSKLLSCNKEYALTGPAINFKTADAEQFLNSGNFDNSQSCNAIKCLFREIKNQCAKHPSGFGYKLKPVDGSKIQFADFAYEDDHILLFSLEKKDSYDIISTTQNKYECYLLTDNFDYVNFVRKIKE